MSFLEMLNELKNTGFMVVKKGDKVNLIKNKKVIDYTEQEWEKLSVKSKIIELNAIIKAFK